MISRTACTLPLISSAPIETSARVENRGCTAASRLASRRGKSPTTSTTSPPSQADIARTWTTSLVTDSAGIVDAIGCPVKEYVRAIPTSRPITGHATSGGAGRVPGSTRSRVSRPTSSANPVTSTIRARMAIPYVVPRIPGRSIEATRVTGAPDTYSASTITDATATAIEPSAPTQNSRPSIGSRQAAGQRSPAMTSGPTSRTRAA